MKQGEAAAIALAGLRRQLEVANAKLRLLTAADGARMLSTRQSTEDFPPHGAPSGLATPRDQVRRLGHGLASGTESSSA